MNMLRRAWPLFPLAFLIVGCGGGGGFDGNFTYKTDWTNFSGASGGQSERVQLFGPTGALVKSLVLNQDTAGIAIASFPGLTPGLYHLEVQLFSLRDAGGTEVGDLDAQLDPSQTPSYISAVGNAVTGVKVSPGSAALSVQQSQQFYVAGVAANGDATFVAPGSIQWTTLGSVGSINAATGLFIASTPGTGSVRATHTPTGLIGAATVTAAPIVTTQGKWTLMVYMNAANDLSQFSLQNFTQMQSAAGNPAVRTIVQWKQVPSLPYPAQFNGTRRYLVQPGTGSTINSKLLQDLGTGVDMGNYQTLNDFINWTKTFYPADHYVLVVWNHGNGWKRSEQSGATRAVSYDDELGTAIQTWQLAQAVGNNHLDILAWDASLMQMAEVSDEIRDKIDYIVGSEESPPGAGYPYDLIFSKFRDNPTDTPRNLSKAFVDGMLQGYASDGTAHITQSVLDTTKLPAVMTSIKDLQSALVANVNNISVAVQNARTNSQTYSQTDTRYYRDLWDLSLKLDVTNVPAILTADAEVRTALANAVVWEGHNNLSMNSHGLAIDFSPASVYSSYSSDYARLRFAADSNWGAWLSVAP